jgi:hypothetical protein
MVFRIIGGYTTPYCSSLFQSISYSMYIMTRLLFFHFQGDRYGKRRYFKNKRQRTRRYSICAVCSWLWRLVAITYNRELKQVIYCQGGLKYVFVSICDNLQHNITKTFLLPYTSAMMQMPPKLVIPNFSEVSVEKNVACLIKFTIINQMKHCACL